LAVRSRSRPTDKHGRRVFQVVADDPSKIDTGRKGLPGAEHGKSGLTELFGNEIDFCSFRMVTSRNENIRAVVLVIVGVYKRHSAVILWCAPLKRQRVDIYAVTRP
jgi:hypothetical protein